MMNRMLLKSLFVVLVMSVGSALAQTPLSCLVEPMRIVNVGSSNDGVLAEVLVERGDIVKAGQVLARLTTGVEKAAVELARARAEFGRRKVERNEELFRKHLISANDRDEMVTEQRIAEAQLLRDEEQLKLRTIASPLTGVVVERFLSPGEQVRQEKERVVRIAQLDPLRVEVIAPVEMLNAVRVGSSAEVRIDPAGGVHRATVTVVDRVVDAASGTFGIRLSLPNSNGRLSAGLKCAVRFLK